MRIVIDLSICFDIFFWGYRRSRAHGITRSHGRTADKRGREGILRLHTTDKKINIRSRKQMFFLVWEYELGIQDGYAASKIKTIVFLIEVHFKERTSKT
jgi:hypothetical protein